MAEESAAGSWVEYVAAAAGREDEAEVLAEACLAHSKDIPASTFAPRSGGAPPGRPDRELARAVAARLLELYPQPVPGMPGIQRVLGLLTLRTMPEPGTEAAALAPSLQAVEEAAALNDPDASQWALTSAARMAWSLRQTKTAEEFSNRALELESATSTQGCLDWSPGMAAGSPAWLSESRVNRIATAVGAATIALSCASTLGDFDRRTAVARTRTRLAEAVRTERPVLFARSMQLEAQILRSQGDWPAVLSLRSGLEELAESDGPDRVGRRVLLASNVGNAEVMNDRSLALSLERERLAVVLSAVRNQIPEGREIGSMEGVLDFLKSRGDVEYRAAIGNSYLGQAANMYMMGALDNDPAAVAAALALLELADKAYEGYGNNGITAVRRSRIRILERSGRLSAEQAVAELLEIEAIALRPVLRRNAVLEMVRLCVPGDVRVRDRVLEGLSGVVSTHTPRYRAAWAIWLSRAAEAAVAEGRVPEWGEVLAEASRAGGELVVGGRIVAPLLSLEVWQVAWRAHAGVHGDDGDLGGRMVLALAAVNALATQLVMLTQPEERSRTAAAHGHVFAEAADLAVRLGDPVSAELVMEAARRERVGLLLGELAHNPKVGEAVREAAEGILVANAATPEEGSFRDGHRGIAWQERSADAIQANRRAAVEAAASVIGPAAALADLSRAPAPVAAALARDTAGEGCAAAVLQLYRPGSDPGTVFWAVEASDGTSECGRADLPVPLPLIEDGSSFWTKLDSTGAGTALVPASLRRFLLDHAASGTGPVRLTIVPTGLLGVPFDQIALSDEVFLLECANVVLTGSLAMARALHHAPSLQGDTDIGWVSVYDHTRLKHTRAESEALAASHAPVKEVGGRDALFAALSPEASRPGLVAMGLHGSGDESGWAQTKLLPDGTSVVAAEALAWQAPPVTVLSSCHSRLETVDGTELSGFPAAFLLRGSSTVIGSLTKIDDKATAGIITRFWHHTAAGHGPAHALAQAKRDWINEDPRRWGDHRLWAPLIAYGTHPAQA